VCVVLIAVAVLVQGCSRGPSEEELKLAEFQQQLAALKEQHAALNQMRTEIESAQATLAELEAVAERQRTDEQKAQIEELTAKIGELTDSQDSAFDQVQSLLADFLNVGINDYPTSSETAEALTIYSDEAILVALDMVEKSGDYKKAIDNLATAQGFFEAAQLTPYHPLEATIAELDDWRFITTERFDAIKNNMTKEQVVEIAGQVYYRNVQVNEEKGVETWLYKKREGGAAAVYFKTKNDKVYNKNFEAVPVTTVVSD
jgi:DNA repair exonuclease SbcCD ATPase subunit